MSGEVTVVFRQKLLKFVILLNPITEDLFSIASRFNTDILSPKFCYIVCRLPGLFEVQRLLI